MSSKSPAFQFYPKDWLTNAKVREMKPAARGVYIDMLANAWLEDLPSDLDRLARRLNVSVKRLKLIWPQLAPCFEVDGNRLVQRRLEVERLKQKAFREKQKANGAKGGKPKKSKGAGNPSLPSGETQPEPNGFAKESFPFPFPNTYLPSGDEIDRSDDLITRHAAAVTRCMAALSEASAGLGIAGADILALPLVRPKTNTPITNPAGVAVSEAGIRLLDTTTDKVQGLMAAKRGDSIAAEQKRSAQPVTIFEQEVRSA